MSNFRALAEVKIVDKDGNDVKKFQPRDIEDGIIDPDAPPESYDPVCLCNNTLQSLFSKVEIGINDTYIASNNMNHHIKSYIMNMVNYPHEARKSMLAPGGFQNDFEKLNTTAAATADGVYHFPLLNSSANTENGKTYKLYGKLAHDLFSVTRLLPPG